MTGKPRYQIDDIVSLSSGEDTTKRSIYVIDRQWPYKPIGPVLSL